MCIITMQSRTAAESARRAVYPIPAQVVAVDPNVTKRGCAYGLSLRCADVSRATAILQHKGIGWGEVLGGGSR